MKRYEKYKDSGNKWVGVIPECWSISKIRFEGKLYGGLTGKAGNDFNNDKNKNSKPFIPFTNIFKNHYISENDFQLVDISKNENQNKVKKDDIFFLMSSEKIEELGICSTILTDIPELYLNSFCKGYRTASGRISNRFLNYQLSGSSHRQIVSTQGRGYTRINLRQDSVLNTPIYFPSLEEQTQIANYLDRKTQQIDALIEKKELLIALLEEERTAIINQAVTKGLDPNVKMKDSGIDWLGEIPEHWKNKRLRYIGTCQNGISASAEFFGEGHPFVSYSDIFNNSVLPAKVNGLAMSEEKHWLNYAVESGDIFFTRTSETVEEIGISSVCEQKIEKATFAGFLIRFRPFKNILHKGFSKYYFRCFIPRVFFVKEMNLVTRASLSQELLKRLPILLPSIDEQIKIASYLDSMIGKLDLTTVKISKEIELLKEYKTTIISEVVTGKIDVRN